MNSILNLNSTWTAANFLNYIEHSFSSTVADWYNSLTEEGNNTLRMMKYQLLCLKIYAKK